MDAELDRKTARLANACCVLGVLSLATIAAAFISPFVTAPVDKTMLGAGLGVAAMVAFIALGGLLLGLIGLVVSLVALRRKIKEGGENTRKGMAITGLVLNGLGVAIVCVLLACALFFASRAPHPPPPPTPPPPIG